MLHKEKFKKFFLRLFSKPEYNRRNYQLEDTRRMPAYVVVLQEPNAQVATKITSLYPATKHYKISPTSYLVSDKTSLASDVTAKLGLNGSMVDKPIGVVFPVEGFYHGFAPRSLWEWLRSNRYS